MQFDPSTARLAEPVSQFDPTTAVPVPGPSTRQILSATSLVAPDAATEAERLAKLYNTTTQSVLADLPTFKRQEEIDRADAALSRSPALSAVVRQDPYKAPQVRDDLVPLSTLAEMVESFKRGFASIRRGSDTQSILDATETLMLIRRIEQGEFATDADIARASRLGSMFAGVGKSPENLANMRQRMLAQIRENIADYRARTKDIQQAPPSPELAQFQAQTETGPALRALASAPVRIATQVAAESLGALLPFMPLIVVGGAASLAPRMAALGLSGANAEYLSSLPEIFTELGVDVTDVAALEAAIRTPEFVEKNRQAMIKAGVIGAGEAITGGLLGVQMAARPVANVAAQAGVGAGVGGASEALGSAASGQEVSASAVISEIIGGLPETSIELGAQAARRAYQRINQTEEATTAADTLQAALQTATESKLRQRSPEEFRAVLEQMGRNTDGTPTQIYVDGEVLNQLAPDVRQLLPQAVQAQIQRAADIGDTVAIPVADVLTVAPGTALEQVLVENARLRPDAMTQAEAREAGEKAQTYLQQERDRVIAQAADQAAARASHDVVKAEIKQQLTATGRFRDAVNEGYATWAAAFYTAYGSRLGMTAEQFYQRYPLRVLGAAPGQQTGVLNAPRLGRLDGLEGFHFSKQDRPVITTAAFGTGLEGSSREQYLNAADRRLRKRSYFYVDKGTGINPEAGVGGRGQRVNLDNVYDADADPLRLKTGRDQLGFESAVLDAGFSGYLTRMEGSQSGQVIMLGDQTFQAEVLGPLGRTQGRPVPPPARRPASGRDVVADALRARRDLPAGELTRERWGQILQRLAPTEYEALAAAGVFEGEGRFYKDGLIREFESRTQAPTYEQAAVALQSTIEEAGGTVEDVMQVDQLIDSKDIPTITVQDLVGKAIFPTIADRTAAAALYTGIDSSTTVAIPLLGGPFFPLRKSNAQAGVVWANRGKGVIAQKAAKLKEGANYMMVLMGDANMHQSNSTVAAAFMATLDAYSRDGRISRKNIDALGKLVREAPSNDPKVKEYLEGFPGFDNSSIMYAYMDGMSFNARKRVLELMASKEALALGAPPMQRILDATREPSLAGHRWGDGVLLVEVDQTNPQVELGTKGTKAHPDYPFGVRGRVVGKLNAPINWQLLWQDWLAENQDLDSPRRAFELAKPIVTVTQDLVDRIGPIEQANIDGARQARLAADFAAGNWRTSDDSVKQGGVSPQAFLDALALSDAGPTLSGYTLDQIKAGIKDGTKKIYQLGDGQIYFLLETRADGTKYLASVVNNEPGARGIGAPAIVLKALQEGATDLDCFAVKSSKYPQGFLPALYSAFGFEVTERYTFDPKYFKPELPKKQRELALADAVKFWQTTTPGFDPSVDMPDAVEMKWKGTDADREGIVERYLRGGLEGLLAGRARADVEAAEAELSAPPGEPTGPATGADVGGAAGDQGAGAGALVASRARGTVQGIAELSDNELANLGLSTADRDAVRQALGLPSAAPEAQPQVLNQGRTATQILADFENARLIPDSAVLATLGEFPEYLRAVTDFMVEQRRKLVEGRMTVRDMAKAYFITIASMGSDAIGVDTLQNKTGMQIDPTFINNGKVRPEEAAAAWLMTPDGKLALDELEAGRFNAALWDKGAGIRRAYGDDRFKTFRAFDSTAKGYNFLRLKELTDKVNAAALAGDFATVSSEVNKLNGIGQGKIGFIKHMLGMGDAPTIDAVEINFWLTGQGEIGQLKTEKADLAREIKAVSSDRRVSAALFDRIVNRFNGLRDQVAGGSIDPGVYQHIMHHWLWDRAKGIETTHEGMYKALRYAQGPRGTFNPATLELVLNPNADLSTWFHETGHFFLEVLADVASQPGAPAQIAEDYNKVLAWFGVTPEQWAGFTLDQKRPYHERWAESIEQYVMEGKAPSVELQPVMRRFSAWLKSVYQSIKQFIAQRGVVQPGGQTLGQDEIVLDMRADLEKQKRAREWAKKISAQFPLNPMNPAQRVMSFGGEDSFALFELDDSVTVPGAVEVKWVQVSEQKRGIGTKAMQELQRLAAADGMALTLQPAENSSTKRAALVKFYAGLGFAPVKKQSKALVWRPTGVLAQGDQQQPLNIQLNDDIRRVMDRMLATDEQIQQANEVAGFTPDEQADGEAAERLQKRSIADLKWAVRARDKVIAKLKREAREIEEQIRAEVTDEVNQRPEVLAKAAIEKAVKEFEADPVAADMNIAAIADSFPEAGWTSVDAMYRAIELFGDKQQAIDGIVERRMLEEHGDLIDERAITEAANEAVHNEARARSLATELRTQQEMLNERADTGQVNARGARMTVNVLVEAAKQFGANVIARTSLKDLRATAWKHTAAERRAGKRWQEATMAGDTQAAVKAKQDQMLNNAAAKAALDAAAEAQKILEFFARVTKGTDEKTVEKGRDPDIVNAARAVLAAYGVQTPASKGAAAYLETLKSNDPETYAALEPMMAVAMANAQPLGALTFEELTGLHESIQAFWFMAKRSRQMEVDGNLLDIDDVAQELFARMEAIGIPDRVPGEGMAVTQAEERGLFLKQGIAFLRRVEQWAEGMDGKYGGPFLRFVFQPIKDAADRYRKDRIDYRKRFQALVDNLAPIVGDSVIEAPELGYTFGTPGSTAGTAMNEILHAIAHTGNDSNKRKLLLGRGWATENPDGTLDTRQWDAFIQRLVNEGKLQEAHFDFVQGVWDLLEDTKPLAQKAHRDAFGRYFSEVTANEFVDPFGVTRRGGYLPAQVDTRLVKDNVLRKMAEEQNNSMAYAFPQPAKGFTISRTEYNQPLMLDLRSLSQHIDKVLLFSHMTNPARDVRKLITRKTVSQPLDRIQPATIESMLQPWLQRSAQQIVETPIVGAGKWARLPGIIRARAGMALMFANISNAVQQITGLSNAAVRVKPSFLMRSLAQYVANPRQFSQAVWGASPYMDDRAKNEVAVLNEQMQAILIKPSTFERAQDFGMRHAYFLQTALDNILSPIVWTGAYNQALADGMSDVDAVRFADSTVRQTQGSTLPEDVSRLETGPAYARVFTQFVGYFNMMANTNGTALKQLVNEVGLKKGAGRALYIVMMGFMAPIWIAEAIALAFKGGPEDEDDDGYLDDWLAQVFGMGTLKGLLAQIPIAGQFAVAGLQRFNDNPLDDRVSLSPAVSLLESSVGAPQSVYKAIVDDGSAQKAIRDVATLVSVATGVPVYGLARPIGYAAGVAQGRIEPESPADVVRGLITGTASPESRAP